MTKTLLLVLVLLIALVFCQEAANVENAAATNETEEEEVVSSFETEDEGVAGFTPFSEADASVLVTLPVHGRYCGPGYCNGQTGDFKKQNCDTTQRAVDCGDECCRTHDRCCIDNRNSCGKCDDGIRSCLKACLSKKKNAMWSAIKFFFDWRGRLSKSCC